jgi:hypothetical protein
VHHELLALRIKGIYGGTVIELLGLRASEFLRMVAMTKAYSWSQPTTGAMQNNLERKRLGL